MKREEKVSKLLNWVKENFDTFQDRARESRLVLMADDSGLDMMLSAIE